MNLTDDIILKALKGSPIFLKDNICAIYPATLGRIVDIGYDNFLKFLQLMLIKKPDADSPESKLILDKINDFQYLFLISSMNEDFSKDFRDAFYFFTKEKIILLPDSQEIVVGDPSEKRIINIDGFTDLQNLIRFSHLIGEKKNRIIINDNDSDAVKQIKKKMIESEKKVAKAKAKKNKQDSNSELDFSDLLCSFTIGTGINMINIWDMTYYAFNDQLKRMGWHEQFELNNRAALAGAKLKKNQLEYWIRSIN